MPLPRPFLWSELTWEELREIPKDSAVCLLPVGATEQHGPHLGTGVDTVVAEKICLAASVAAGALVLPPLPYGCSLGHSQRWPGTIPLTPELVTELVRQIVAGACHAGFRRFILVNGHVTNFAPLRCALELIRAQHDQVMVAVCNLAEISPRVRQEFFADAIDWHANAAETALMMVKAPELVREDKVKGSDDPDRTAGLVFSHPVNRTSVNGVTGYPSRATLYQGDRLFSWMVEDLAELIRKGSVEQPPLGTSYFQSV